MPGVTLADALASLGSCDDNSQPRAQQRNALLARFWVESLQVPGGEAKVSACLRVVAGHVLPCPDEDRTLLPSLVRALTLSSGVPLAWPGQPRAPS